MSKWITRIFVIATVIALAFLIFRFQAVIWIYKEVALWLSLNLELGDQAVALLAMALTAIAIPIIPYFMSFVLFGRGSGKMAAIVVVFAGVAFGGLYMFGGNVFFTPDGQAMRCWAMTPVGIKITERMDPAADCGFDRTFNIQYEPLTPEIAPSVLAARSGRNPVQISAEEVRRIGYFGTADGRSNVWYTRLSNGRFTLFDGPGFDPKLRKPLKPVTPQNISEIDKFVESEIRRITKGREQAAADKRRRDEEARIIAQARLAEQKRLEIERQNRSDLSLAQMAFNAGNLLAARDRLSAILNRNPNHESARKLFDTWNLTKACANCGSVVHQWREQIKQDGTSKGASVGGALGFAAGEHVGRNTGNNETAQAIGTLAGAAIGDLMSRKSIYFIQLRMDNGEIVAVPTHNRLRVENGQRVLVSTDGQSYRITPQTAAVH